MPDHDQPDYLFTTYLSLSHIFLSHEHTQVSLLGVYGNLVTGEINEITIECDFEMLNDMLALVDDQAEQAIESLSYHITHPTSEIAVIDLSCSGLHFEEHIFALQVIFEVDETGNSFMTEDVSYSLNGFVKRESILPSFVEVTLPAGIAERALYYNQLLAMQYHLYLHFQKKTNTRQALVISNLVDPLVFALAKTQYELQAEARKKGQWGT